MTRVTDNPGSFPEHTLAETMNSDQWRIRPPADALQRIGGEVLRRRRRRRAGAVTLAVAVLLGGGLAIGNGVVGDGVSKTGPAEGGTPPGVPWIDTPGTAYHAGAQVQPPCRAPALSLSLGHTGAWQGLATQDLVVTNTSGVACSLRAPLLRVVPASGGPAADVGAGERNDSVVLDPAEAATVKIGAPGGCEGGAEDAAAAVELRDAEGRTATTEPQAFVPLLCGKPVLVSIEDQVEDVPNAPTAGLEAQMQAVAVADNRHVTFQVVLSNPTDHDISLQPCPSYSIVVNGKPSTYELNCADVSSIKAGQQVTWNMEADVPGGGSTSDTKLGWHLEIAGGASVAQTIDVG